MPIAPHAAYDRLMPHMVSVQAKTGYDTYGAPSYSGTVQGPWKALVIDMVSTRRDQNGIEIMTTTTAYVNTDGNRINSDDRVILPVEFGGSKRKIGQVINWPDGSDGAIYAVEVGFL